MNNRIAVVAALSIAAAFGVGFWVSAAAPRTWNVLTTMRFNTPSVCEAVTCHTVPGLSKRLFEDAYAAARMKFAADETATRGDGQRARALIVPHHLLVADRVAQAFDGVASDRKVTVLLIAPNHFTQGRAAVITSARPWNTPFGVLQSNAAAVAALTVATSTIAVEEAPFAKEHAVYSIVPFIRASLPNATIVPIMIRDSVTSDTVAALADIVHANVPDDVLIVGSFDFSHYLPEDVALFHDQTAGTVLQTLDARGARTLDIDSRPGLQFMLEMMRDIDAEGEATLAWRQIARTSSNSITKKPESSENTSHFTGYYVTGGRVEVPRFTIHAFGDMMLDRKVRATFDAKGDRWPYAKIERFISGSDITVANLETPLTTFKSVAKPNGLLTFTSEPRHAKTLYDLGITMVSLGNNHTHNFGESGLKQTHKYLTEASVDYFGDPLNRPVTAIRDVRGQKVGFVAFHQFTGDNGVPALAKMIRELEPKTDYIVAMPHWGVEYQQNGWHSSQEVIAHAMIDAGADVVIGAHPHVVQPIEVYKGKAIFYSLGNFIFDQLFSEPTKTGLTVGLSVEPTATQFILMPVYNNAMQMELLLGSKRAILCKDLSQHSRVSDAIKKQLINCSFSLPR
ncbi:MAG: AmmeMemoRadiSam system protein B [Patescibacteria group bacterium]